MTIERMQQSEWNLLSPKDQEIAWFVLNGLSYSDISKRLGMNVKEVENCVRRIYTTFKANSLQELRQRTVRIKMRPPGAET